MFKQNRVIAVIPARAGSKGVLNKNIKELGGKPLLAWPIDIAKQSKYIDEVVVSTDGDLIAEVANKYGATVVKRPIELAQDNSLAIDAIRHVISVFKESNKQCEIVVVLEATCPLRSVEDVDNAIEKLDTFDSVATYTEASLNPHRAWRIEDSSATTFIDNVIPWLPRQALPRAYQLNGAAYAFYTDRLPKETNAPLFGKSGAVIMPQERSLDIDTEVDFLIVEHFINRR